MGQQARPLIGKMSCGQAEKAITTSISARSRTKLPGVETGGSKETVPSGWTGMFMNRFSGLGVSAMAKPISAIAAQRLSWQLSWCPFTPRPS